MTITPALHFASSRSVKGLSLPGARAKAAATSTWLAGNFFEEPVDFIFLCLSKADDLKVVFAFRVGHAHHLARQPPHCVKAQLNVGKAFVLIGSDGPIEDSLAAREVAAAVANVLTSFRVAPGRHARIVATKSVFRATWPITLICEVPSQASL